MNKSKEDMLWLAEKLDDNKKNLLKLTLRGGTILIGYSAGIEYEEDEKGDDYDVLAFQCPDLNHFFWFSNAEIKSVELANA